ncbi:hypothetical protein, partial [Thermoflexus sp.]|uniref:DUF7452 domain-containing protein n=1 Tax=Thermoflexus sp. TaxID=1969742 RepID=UPI00261C3184
MKKRSSSHPPVPALRRLGFWLTAAALLASAFPIPPVPSANASLPAVPEPAPQSSPVVIAAFQHIAAPPTLRANQTILDHPMLKGNPNVLLFVTADYGTIGPYHEKPVGVWYDGIRWTIFNQDGSPMTPNVRFNVLAVKPGDPAYMHVAHLDNISGSMTSLDHP